MFAVFVGFLGLIIGSFLNVVIARVPHGGSVVRPPSACPNCHNEIAWFDNVPVVSWLVLRARCRKCATPIAIRYPAVELATGLLFALDAAVVGMRAELPAVLLFTAGGVALSVIDIELFRLPTRIIYVTLGLVAAALVGAAVFGHHPRHLVTAAAGAAIATTALFLILMIYPRGMGWGDVRLAALLGAILGWYGLGRVALGLFGGYLVGAVVGLVIAAIKGKLRGTKMPFGPSLIAGTMIAVLWGGPILDWYLRSLNR